MKSKAYPQKIFIIVAAIISTAHADTDASRKGWKNVQNKNGWGMQYPSDWLNAEESDNFIGGRAEKGIASEHYSTAIRSGEVPVGGQAAWIRITVGKPKWINEQTKRLDQQIIIDNLKENIEHAPGHHDFYSSCDGHAVKVSGYPGYDDVVTIKTSNKKETVYRTYRYIKAYAQNKVFTLQYYEGDGLGGNELPRNKWKFEKKFDEIVSSFKITL